MCLDFTETVVCLKDGCTDILLQVIMSIGV